MFLIITIAITFFFSFLIKGGDAYGTDFSGEETHYRGALDKSVEFSQDLNESYSDISKIGAEDPNLWQYSLLPFKIFGHGITIAGKSVVYGTNMINTILSDPNLNIPGWFGILVTALVVIGLIGVAIYIAVGRQW